MIHGIEIMLINKAGFCPMMTDNSNGKMCRLPHNEDGLACRRQYSLVLQSNSFAQDGTIDFAD
jgi:hypothetical protein